MIFSPITTMNTAPLIPPSSSSRVQSPSFIRKRNLPTPPPSLADVNDSSSCSSSASSVSSAYSTTTTNSSTTHSDNNNTVASCDLLNIITDARFRPVFQAIDEIKRRKCRPDLERILKYVGKRNITYQRDEILLILDDLLKIGLITKVFHKGGFTIRIKNEKYAKLIEKMNVCYNQKTPTATPMSPHEAMAAAAAAGTLNLNDQQWSLSKPYLFNSNEMTNKDHYHNHTRETPSPEFAVFKMEPSSLSPLYSSIDQNNNTGKLQMIKENTLTNGSMFLSPLPPSSANTKSTKKRNRSQTTCSNDTKKSRSIKTSDPILSTIQPPPPPSPLPILPIINPTTDEHLFRKPLLTHNNLPPITIEQILGLRGDIPDVHNWTASDLNEFFHQQGYEYASILLNKYNINGNKLYELKREQVFRMSTLKVGKTLKLWNVIEQIQQKSLS